MTHCFTRTRRFLRWMTRIIKKERYYVSTYNNIYFMLRDYFGRVITTICWSRGSQCNARLMDKWRMLWQHTGQARRSLFWQLQDFLEEKASRVDWLLYHYDNNFLLILSFRIRIYDGNSNSKELKHSGVNNAWFWLSITIDWAVPRTLTNAFFSFFRGCRAQILS